MEAKTLLCSISQRCVWSSPLNPLDCSRKLQRYSNDYSCCGHLFSFNQPIRLASNSCCLLNLRSLETISGHASQPGRNPIMELLVLSPYSRYPTKLRQHMPLVELISSLVSGCSLGSWFRARQSASMALLLYLVQPLVVLSLLLIKVLQQLCSSCWSSRSLLCSWALSTLI